MMSPGEETAGGGEEWTCRARVPARLRGREPIEVTRPGKLACHRLPDLVESPLGRKASLPLWAGALHHG